MRLTLVLPALCGLGLGLLALAWYDVLPGGYRLRGLVEDHASRAAREQREQRERSDARLAEFAAGNASAPAGSIVFLGSSTIERFPLAELFPEKPCLDRGIGNESARECLARLDESLPAADPAAFCLYLASIDFRRLQLAPPQVVQHVLAIVQRLRARYPEAPMALIGLLSERSADAAFVRRWRAVNAALEAAAAAHGLAWVDVDRLPLTSPAGRLAENMSTDELHLGPAGYAQLARWILEDGGAVGLLLAP